MASPVPVFERQPRMGDDGDGPGDPPVLVRKRTGSRMCSGPVEQFQPDDVHAHRFERRDCARDVGAEQHAAARIECHLRLHRDAASQLGETTARSGQCRLHFEDVLRGLYEQHVHATLDQVLRLPVEVSASASKVMLPSAGSLLDGNMPVGPMDPATKRGTLRRGVFVARGAGEPGRLDIQLARLVLETPLLQRDVACSGRYSSLHHVAAHGEERLVDRLDDVGRVRTRWSLHPRAPSRRSLPRWGCGAGCSSPSRRRTPARARRGRAGRGAWRMWRQIGHAERPTKTSPNAIGVRARALAED
jgi:hypothetical protein